MHPKGNNPLSVSSSQAVAVGSASTVAAAVFTAFQSSPTVEPLKWSYLGRPALEVNVVRILESTEL